MSKSSEQSSAKSTSLIGTKLGDFQVMRKLGRGGMADVYAARQVSLGRDVALKVLRNEHAGDKDYVERFRREARAAAKLNHPNIVQVFDVGNFDTKHYISQELVDGDNLRQHIDRHGAIDAELAVEVLIGVASALRVANEAGITHRDIKPENIMQSSRGVIKVADFGLARFGGDVDVTGGNLTQAGLTMGTPRYMSPEQVQGKLVDVRSDLYSLGITMYHLLTGRPPFEADEPLALALMHLQDTPLPIDRVRNARDADGNPDLPEWLIAIVDRLISKPPADRFQSPDELINAIRDQSPSVRLDNLGPGTAAATIRLQRATDYARRHQSSRYARWLLAIGLPVLSVGVATALIVDREGKSVEEMLRPQVVAKSDDVEEQYLNAVIRGDEMGWIAVAKYFPPESSANNAAYYAKSQLQLARLLAEQGQPERSDRILRDLSRNPNIDRIYQAIAMLRRDEVLQDLGRNQTRNDLKLQFQSLHADLQASNPAVLAALERVVSKRQLLKMGVGDL